MLTSIIYIQRGVFDAEAKLLRQAGYHVQEWVGVEARAASSSWDVPVGSVLFRGPRIPLSDFQELYNEGRRRHLNSIVDVATFRLGGTPEHQAEVFGQMMPRMVVLKGTDDATAILSRLTNGTVAMPAMVRSEVESAAKYVGFEGCIVRSAAIEDVERVLADLRRHVPSFEQIILKELVPVSRTAAGKALEYRAVGIQGELVAFDWRDDGAETPSPDDIGLGEFAQRAFTAAADAGASGPLVVDVALSERGTGFIVECKNLLNSSLKGAPSVIRRLENALRR